MRRSDYFRLFWITAAVFTVIDLIWLGFIGRPIYDHYLGDFLADEPVIWSAALFYGLFIIGLLYFALIPGVKGNDRTLALKNAAVFGFMTYMTYELTNHAVIEGWPAGIVFIDIAWGVILATSVTRVSYDLYKLKT